MDSHSHQSPPNESARIAPRRRARLTLALGYAVELACAWLGGRLFYHALNLRAGRFDVRHERVDITDLPSGLDGMRIAQLSDLHAGNFLREGDLRDVVDAVNELAVDLVVLTGDYISHHWTDAAHLCTDFARLRSRYGTFAVFGNHDYRDRAEGRIALAFAESSVTLLRDANVRIETTDGVLAIVGLEDLTEAKALETERAFAALQPTDTRVLLCHNPLGAERLAHKACALVLSGHTHGTQIHLPLLRRLGPPHPGDRRQVQESVAITNRGLGVVGVPLRWGSRAEVVVVTLRNAASYSEPTMDGAVE